MMRTEFWPSVSSTCIGMESRLIPRTERGDPGCKGVSCNFTSLFDSREMAVGQGRDDVGDAREFSTVT